MRSEEYTNVACAGIKGPKYYLTESYALNTREHEINMILGSGFQLGIFCVPPKSQERNYSQIVKRDYKII